MNDDKLSWTIPVMRAGYAGRGLVYLVVAGFSLYAALRGGSGESTGSALQKLETAPLGNLVLVAIVLGMAAYALWRYVDAAYDLEDYGKEAKGLIARIGMVTTGTIHLGIGFAALAVLVAAFGSSGGGEGSSIARATAWVMSAPLGRWIVGLAGGVTIGAGIYYFVKALSERYRDHLVANRFTEHWNLVLKAGVLAQGTVVAIIGGLFVYAAVVADPSAAGGVGSAFSWLSQQIYGQILVIAVSLGLLAFAFFCAVNAAYRYVPRVAQPDVETLASRMARKSRAALS